MPTPSAKAWEPPWLNHRARTELSFVIEAIAFAEANGFSEWTADTELMPGTRVYKVNRDRAISLLVLGEEPLCAS